MQQEHQYVRYYLLVITVDHGEERRVRARFTVTQNKWIKI